jgi:hypothetical protein
MRSKKFCKFSEAKIYLRTALKEMESESVSDQTGLGQSEKMDQQSIEVSRLLKKKWKQYIERTKIPREGM